MNKLRNDLRRHPVKRKTLLAAAAILASVTFAGAAQATPLNFHFAGNDGSTVDFTLDSTPTPTYSISDVYAEFEGVTGFENGTASDFGGGVDFYAVNPADKIKGGFDTFDLFAQTTGPQIYTGPEANPVFAPGTFQLSAGFLGNGGTLSISSASPVPEPGVLGMFALGLLGVTVLARKKTGKS